MRVGLSCVRNILRRESISKQPARQRMNWRREPIDPAETKSYAQRVAGLNIQDKSKEINIGFLLTTKKGKEKDLPENIEHIADNEDLDEEHIRECRYHQTTWSKDSKNVAQHHGIYRDLFDDAYFYPQFPLKVSYEFDDDMVTAICNGNTMTPSEVVSAPVVEYDGDPDTLYTLALTAPDSHLQDNKAEYLHWLIGNIPGDEVSKGEQLCSYLLPFPARGTGFHRYVFVLYQQERKVDFSEERRPTDCVSLQERTFSTSDFYRRFQNDLTPVSLAYFQSEWDESVTNTFWNKLDMKEPSFEFMFPPPYHAKQKKFPLGQPFNLYLDRYRDVKDLNEEVLKEKLKTSTPFTPPAPRPKYPGLIEDVCGPKWLRFQDKNKRLRQMHWKDLD